jgi:hypothetical protein
MKKTVQNLLLLVFIFVCHFSNGQNNMGDVVYLKNGSVIKGTIIEQVPNESIKLETRSGDIFVFKTDEIEKMVKENLQQANAKKTPQTTSTSNSGFFQLVESNWGLGVLQVKNQTTTSKYEVLSFGFRSVNGYQFNEHLTLGLGVGIDVNNNVNLPITFDVRATLLKGKISPVFTTNIGYAIGLFKTQGGLVLNPQIGIKNNISNNMAYFFNFGYKFQTQHTELSSYGLYSTKRFYHLMTISTGFTF